jgi:enterochelin esterase-like enzyme
MPALEMPRPPRRAGGRRRLRAGAVTHYQVASAILGNERRVWVYTPPGYSDGAGPYDTLLLFDGGAYIHDIPMPTIVDGLIDAGRIPPLVALLPDSLDEKTRDRELTCHLPFVAFLADELLPWARKCYHLAADPARATVGGSSYGGLAAAFAALSRPDLFGKVLAQSGSFWWKPDDDPEHEWLARQFVDTPRLPIEFYLSVGVQEAKARITPHQLIVNRHMRNILRAKGYPVHYAEYDGRHHVSSWRDTFADGLLALAGAEGH